MYNEKRKTEPRKQKHTKFTAKGKKTPDRIDEKVELEDLSRQNLPVNNGGATMVDSEQSLLTTFMP